MITSVTSQGGTYTIAVCDTCLESCPGSKVPGRRGPIAAATADAIALRNGYVERRATRKRGRRAETVVELVCPKCQAKEGGAP